MAPLGKWHVQVSMTENSDPLENPVTERINGILKQEYLSHQPVRSLDEAQQHLERAVFLYNYKRPHLSCNYQAPMKHTQGLRIKTSSAFFTGAG